MPVPPLSAMGLDRFGDFEQMDAGGITYLDTYFVRADYAHDESLHFHELVHVVQWRLLGTEKFLALYADGLERFGYRNSPLEVMAYDLQDRFECETQPFDVEVVACRVSSQSSGEILAALEPVFGRASKELARDDADPRSSESLYLRFNRRLIGFGRRDIEALLFWPRASPRSHDRTVSFMSTKLYSSRKNTGSRFPLSARSRPALGWIFGGPNRPN